MLKEADGPSSAARTESGAVVRDGKGLRTPGLLGRRPWIGLLLVIVGLSAFALFAINVQTNGPLVQDDVTIAKQIHEVTVNSPVAVRWLSIAGFYLGQHFIVAIGLLLAVYFIYRRFWPELAMVVIAWAGEGSLWLVLSDYFDRPRPVFENAVWHTLDVPGFPSGHSISAVMCYGLLAYLIAPRMKSRHWKAAVITLAVAIILFIAFSRVFIGHHYLTDVLAGLALGLAWSSVVYTGVELVMRRRAQRTTQGGRTGTSQDSAI